MSTNTQPESLISTIEVIKATELYINTSDICKELSEHQNLYLTSFFGLTIAVALADGQIFQPEVDEILSSLPSSINLNKDIKLALVELNISHSILAKGYSTELPHFLLYLCYFMNEEAKIKTVTLLYKLGFSDGELNHFEDQLIICFATKFNISTEKINLIRDHCKKKLAENAPQLLEKANLINKVKKINPGTFIMSSHSIEKINAEKLKNNFESIPAYFFVKRTCPDLSSVEVIFLTSYLGLVFSMISADAIIHEKEILYINQELKYWFNFDQNTVNSLMDLFIYLHDDRAINLDHIKVFSHTIKCLLPQKEHKPFIKILLNVAKADSQIDNNEFLIIKKISRELGIDTSILERLSDEALGVLGSLNEIYAKQEWF